MRLNKFVAQATGMSRRAADQAIADGRVQINHHPASLGQEAGPQDIVTLDGQVLAASQKLTIILNKPVGYVCSRDGQGSKTIYDLLPSEFAQLKPVGRLDKDSSGLILLTNDGDLAHQLTHPSFQKTKIYEVMLYKTLTPEDFQAITKKGVPLDDGTSKFGLEEMGQAGTAWRVTMHEGRNRQIRRTFAALEYTVKSLHRTHFGPYTLKDIPPGKYEPIPER